MIRQWFWNKEYFFLHLIIVCCKRHCLRLFWVPSVQLGPKIHCPHCCCWEKNYKFEYRHVALNKISVFISKNLLALLDLSSVSTDLKFLMFCNWFLKQSNTEAFYSVFTSVKFFILEKGFPLAWDLGSLEVETYIFLTFMPERQTDTLY